MAKRTLESGHCFSKNTRRRCRDDATTCNRLSCAARVVASVCSVCIFRSSSDIYRIFLSFDLAADCLFAQILSHGKEKKRKYQNTKNIKVKNPIETAWFLKGEAKKRDGGELSRETNLGRYKKNEYSIGICTSFIVSLLSRYINILWKS